MANDCVLIVIRKFAYGDEFCVKKKVIYNFRVMWRTKVVRILLTKGCGIIITVS